METKKLEGLPDPNYRVFGADTSLWSLEVDFEKYKAAGASFVIIKALHGTTPDPFFVRNYSRARAAGVRVSSYQWLLSEAEAPIRDQVQAYADLLRDHPHQFVPWLDYEGEVGARDLIRYVDLFLQTTGTNLGLYSSYARLNDATPSLPERFSSLRLWIAKYSSGFPAVPQPFKTWDLWQFTENFPGEQLGFAEDGERQVDMNYFNGSADTFGAFCDPKGSGTAQERLEQRIAWEVPRPPVSMGDAGIAVLKLQDLLVRQAFMTTAQAGVGPGVFGPRTRTALINMQTALGCPSSGIFDEATRAAVIGRYYAPEPSAPIDVTPSGPTPDSDPVEERMLFDGNALYRRYMAKLPRGDVPYHVLKVDLSNAEIFVTPPPKGLKMVPQFLEEHSMDIAVNGDGWTMSRTIGGFRVQTTGENASRGKTYGLADNQMAFYIDAQNRVSRRRPGTRELWNAISFPNLLVEDGQIFPRIARADIDPRTAIGFTQDGRYAILIAVDGAETYNAKTRSGMNFTEVASILIRHGAWIGSNQDGGGSTTMAIRDDKDGAVRILNDPCGEGRYECRGKTYSVRPVANAFCIRFLASTPASPSSEAGTIHGAGAKDAL
jgi:GH25 family lysozyme M1 (1,4-beta-N-acetylmuramidase)